MIGLDFFLWALLNAASVGVIVAYLEFYAALFGRVRG